MAVSNARKKANSKWNASRDNITIRLEKDTGSAIRAAAAVQEISVTQYILNCVNATAPGGDFSLPVMLQKKIYDHLKITGESLGDFLARAAASTMDIDNETLEKGLPLKVDTKEGVIYPHQKDGS